VRPKRKLNLAIGSILGFLLGIGAAYFRNYLPDTIESAEAIGRISSSPILGTIPEIKGVRSRLHAVRSPKGTEPQSDNAGLSQRKKLITQLETWSPISEAYRTLRTNIRFTGIDSPVKTILISSPGPSEGKSTTVANLAITMAEDGAKTLVVDSDLRKPIVDTLLNSKNTIGLTNLLRAECTLDEAIAVTDIPNLSVLGSGPLPPNPSEMLGSNRMKSLMAALRDRFDYVLLDSPPVVTVTDAALLAATVDATLLVVRSGVSSREGLARAISLLSNVRARFVGTVFNAADIGLGYGRYFDYYRDYRNPDDSNS
jgi:capsular exopolysaccharide synthesis family protein